MIKKAKDLVDNAVRQLVRFQSKEEVPAVTSFEFFNIMNLGGIYKGNIITIAARPGVGKSYFAQTIENDFLNKELNPNADNYVLLKCNWEMSVFKLLTRGISRRIGKSYRQVLSSPPTEEEKSLYADVCNQERRDNIFYCDTPLTPSVFEKEIGMFLEEHKDKEIALISIDHFGLILNNGKGKKDAIDELVEVINRLRHKYPNATFLNLIQLNRDIESRTDVKEQAPQLSDIMNSDTVGQISDCVIILNNPSLLRFERYLLISGIKRVAGVEVESKYSHLKEVMLTPDNKMTNLRTTTLENKPILYYHFCKVRDGVDESNHYRDLYYRIIS